LILLRKHTLFGEAQPTVERVLKARIQTILRRQLAAEPG